MQDLISVIIPSFNRANTIKACVDSVLKQTYRNIEVIVVDDASTDNTVEVLKSIVDDRFRYYGYKTNMGACYARNYGVSNAVGKYITFQDSDDIWLPEKLEKEINYLKDNNFDFVFCGMNRVSADGKTSYHPPYEFSEVSESLQQLLVENAISTQTMIMKSEVTKTIHFDETFKRFQDWDFALQVAIHKYKIGYLALPLVNSEVQPNSISANGAIGEAYEHLFEKYKNLYINCPHALSTIYMYQARGYRGKDYSKVINYLKLSLKAEWNNKTFVKLMLSYLHLWK